MSAYEPFGLDVAVGALDVVVGVTALVVRVRGARGGDVVVGVLAGRLVRWGRR